MALSTLVEIKQGSSIDPNIKMVRCLLCKAPVLYFKTQSGQSLQDMQQSKQMPAAYTTVYLTKETKDPQAVEESQKMAEYSEPFGVVLLSAYVGETRGYMAHVPRELQQRVSRYMQQQETSRDERVREYIRAQDAELERVRQQTREQSSIVAEIINKVHPQTAATAEVRKSSGGSSGLAAMLRGGANNNISASSNMSGSYNPSASYNSNAGMNPFARGSAVGARPADSLSDNEFELDDHDFSAIGVAERASGLGLNLSRGVGSRQSDDYSDAERDEGAFGDFDGSRAPRATGRNTGNLSHMMAGSMPIQIPLYGSSLTGDPSLNRRAYHQRADELEMNRRREQLLRGMPKTFVPPHELGRMHENDSEMLVGSKPRDSYGMSRRQAPG
ncbi:hypothetical protein GGH96_001919 [Coemansia sp. RSA 1972]|nr:hypothetical protein GGH96_001919 [Coemansia sp. RSA 1972]